MKNRVFALTAVALFSGLHPFARAEGIAVKVQAEPAGKPISPDLFGIFFEDINYAADGGLYAELVQNRSFEYSPEIRKEWTALSFWELVQNGGGQGSIAVETASPLNANNPNYAVLTVGKPGAGVGLKNGGFDGIAVKAGEKYDVSFFARQLDGIGGALNVRLERKSGALLGEMNLPRPSGSWKKYSATLQAKDSDADARLVLLAKGGGRLALDMVSLFPHATFHDRTNGLRADLAQVIADIHPKFMRFPGGCLVHGDGLENMYRWKETIGPVEQRKGQANIWRYYQSVGLGYFEYFQFCEDIGAKPLPIVAAGVCCQNSNQRVTKKWGVGQKGLPMDQMPAYIQEVLDLIEWANGPATSKWGAKRAAAGHPAPFHLEYLGVGNEDKITPVFKERFQVIYNAVKAKHPEITVVGTVGPFPDGEDFENGWKIADELRVPIVDEHYYKAPQWFLDNRSRYDSYDRGKSHVYVGEYAAHDDQRRSTLRSALAEAAYMTSLERNGDVVRMASYAPLLANRGHTQWNPNLIYFTNNVIAPTINYHVQRMFGSNSGDTYLPTTVSDPALSVSTVRDSKSGDLILKMVNTDAAPKPLRVDLTGVKNLASSATKTVLTGDPMAVNEFGTPHPLVPETSPIALGESFEYEAPANSLTVIRVKGSKNP